jgi:hypothetical protein
VLYYAQGTQPEDLRAVGRWTREAIDSIAAHGGRYYLPYQPHATRAQFARAYPRASDLFALKARLDPAGRFTNVLWDLYAPVPGSDTMATVSHDRFPAALPAEVRLVLDTVPGYTRVALAGVVAHPEWDLVWSSDAMRDWLAAGGRPSGFAWLQSIGTFWRSYHAAWRHATRVGSVPKGFHSMLMVIGISTTVEYTLTGLYENTVGRLTEWIGGVNTASDALAREQAAAYSDLIHQAGWYRFSFLPYVPRLWKAPFGSWGQILRSLERKLFLTVIWSGKALYAQLLTWTQGAEKDHLTRHLVMASRSAGRALPGATARDLGWRGYELLEVPRYRPYEELLWALADDPAARIVEINGSPGVTLTVRVPEGGTLPEPTTVIAQYRAVPDRPGALPLERVLVDVPVTEVLDVLRVLRAAPGVTVDHIYDF